MNFSTLLIVILLLAAVVAAAWRTVSHHRRTAGRCDDCDAACPFRKGGKGFRR